MTKRYGRLALGGAAWIVLCLLLPALAETLNGLKPGGTPLGVALVAQAAPLLLLAAAGLMSRRAKSHDNATDEGPAR